MSGALGLQMITDKPVASITKQVGYISYAYRDVGEERVIVKPKSKCFIIESANSI